MDEWHNEAELSPNEKINKKLRAYFDGKIVRKQLEVDFVANLGSRRYYIQSALHLPDEEKARQEKAPLREVPDSFSKIVLVRDVVKPTYDNEGILTMSMFDFLLDEESLPK